ncbi:hypothetical protein HaLaN_30585 [Haematococcus lacustris]|uniref:Uncharacterized protein n=1 Tax=Haematococcus lacustris TaxID=44745 RepID=A0A6A0AHL9_HAELA|nr:hypothetical protein HaLaN_30585 [Haematococcus lacustris]
MVQASASRSNLPGVSRPASLGVVNESGFESQADSLNDVAVKEFGQTLARNQDTGQPAPPRPDQAADAPAAQLTSSPAAPPPATRVSRVGLGCR